MIATDKSFRTCSNAPNQKSLSFFKAPPAIDIHGIEEAQICLACPVVSSGERAFKGARLKMYAPSPWISLAPDFVIALKTVPTVLPNSGAEAVADLLDFREEGI